MRDLLDWLRPDDGREVRRCGAARSVVVRRRYDAPVDEVWDACTDPGRIGRWLGTVTGDPVQGGEIQLDMGPDEIGSLTILRCDPPRRLVVSWRWTGEPDSAAELRLTPDQVGGGTLLELRHLGLDSDRLATAYGEGWESGLWKLDQLLHGIEPVEPPWPEIEATLDPYWRSLPTRSIDDESAWPGVAGDGDLAVLTVGRSYDAEPADVWSALTDPERLGRWFGTTTVDDRAWTVTFDGGKASGVIRECVAGERLVTSWRWDHETTESVLTVRLEPDGAGSRLWLEQTGVESGPAIGYGAGWHAHLVGLARHVGGTDPVEADWNVEFSLARLVLQRR